MGRMSLSGEMHRSLPGKGCRANSMYSFIHKPAKRSYNLARPADGGLHSSEQAQTTFTWRAESNTIKLQAILQKYYGALIYLQKLKLQTRGFFCNFMPTFCNLNYKRLMASANYRKCQNEVETREHVFKKCPMNRLHSGRWVELTDPWVRINFDASAFVAKAMACLQVVHLELFLGLREVEIEGDSRSVIQKWAWLRLEWWKLWWSIEDG